MSWQERETRNGLRGWLAGLIFASALGAPLAAKFAKDAEALSASGLPPVTKGVPKDIPPTPKLVETPLVAETPTPEITPTPEVEVQEVQAELKVEVQEAKTGIELLEQLGLKGKIVYSLYGRPRFGEEQTWGSLGGSRTAEESWQLLKERKEMIKQIIDKSNEDFALNIINPVYRAPIGPIKDIYIQKALELAPENQGLVALNFNSISEAQETIKALEAKFPKELLQYLAVGLDIEHFKDHKTTASELNQFNAWFAQKHQEWAGDSLIPGLVILYTFHGPITGGGKGEIENIGELVQYYLPQKTLAVVIFDGYGSKKAKRNKMGEIVNSLKPNNEEKPGLVGGMEFRSLHGDDYDSASIMDTYNTLQGAPVFFFASQ